MTNKEWYDYCVEHGLCVSCHKPNDRKDGKRYCSECARKNSIRNAQQREFYIAMGVCPICRKNTLIGNMKSCDECRANRAERDAVRSPQQLYIYNANRRKRLREEHRCIRCGSLIPMTDTHTTCSKCREKRREEYSVKHSQDRKNRSLNNKCYICGSSDLLDGKNVCVLCYKRILKNTEKMHQSRKRKTDD